MKIPKTESTHSGSILGDVDGMRVGMEDGLNIEGMSLGSKLGRTLGINDGKVVGDGDGP